MIIEFSFYTTQQRLQNTLFNSFLERKSPKHLDFIFSPLSVQTTSESSSNPHCLGLPLERKPLSHVFYVDKRKLFYCNTSFWSTILDREAFSQIHILQVSKMLQLQFMLDVELFSLHEFIKRDKYCKRTISILYRSSFIANPLT
jgi:hypothetical protein